MFVKEIISNRWQSNPTERLRKMAGDPIEQLHLKFLKWALGLHKKSSNILCWDDIGRCPLIQTMSKQAADYFQRLSAMSQDNTKSLARHSFEEQKKLKLPWYENMVTLFSQQSLSTDGEPTANGREVKETLRGQFQSAWSNALADSPKLEFYRQDRTRF